MFDDRTLPGRWLASTDGRWSLVLSKTPLKNDGVSSSVVFFFIKWESIFSIQLGIYFLSEKYEWVMKFPIYGKS